MASEAERRAKLLTLKSSVRAFFEMTTVAPRGKGHPWTAAFRAIRTHDYMAESFLDELHALLEYIEAAYGTAPARPEPAEEEPSGGRAIPPPPTGKRADPRPARAVEPPPAQRSAARPAPPPPPAAARVIAAPAGGRPSVARPAAAPAPASRQSAPTLPARPAPADPPRAPAAAPRARTTRRNAFHEAATTLSAPPSFVADDGVTGRTHLPPEPRRRR